ncbi:MAG: hypothetical protein AB1846_12965 [Chloroflexota bacterium]
MARPKFDGVIEAVRYDKDGRILLVRAYERRGAAFSDRVLIDRAKLLEKLKQGRKFFTGQRKEYWAGTFDLGKPVERLAFHDKEFITTSGQSGRDLLENIPLF